MIRYIRYIILLLCLLTVGEGIVMASPAPAQTTQQDRRRAEAKRKADKKRKADQKRRQAAKKKAEAKRKAATKRKAAAARKKLKQQKAAAQQRAQQQQQRARQQQTAQRRPAANGVEYIPASWSHYLDFWGSVGYSSLMHKLPETKIPGGVGFELGVGYEAEIRRWLLKAGVEFQFLNSLTTINDAEAMMKYLYTPLPGHQMDYTYQYSDGRFVHNAGLINFPLMFGYRFTDHFYGLVGVRIGIGCFGTIKYSATQYVYATDPELSEELHNVGHLTGTTKLTHNRSWTAGIHVAPSIELGYQFDERFRLGAFAEYGVLDVNDNRALLADVASTVHPLYVGVRFTARVALPVPPRKIKKPALEPLEEPVIPEPEPVAVEPEPIIEEPAPTDTVFFDGQAIVAEQPVVLENLLFVFDRAEIIPESTAALDSLVAMLIAHSDLIINIIGHTDAWGSDSYNLRLSERRAKAVRDYLVRHGVEAYRLLYEGRGAREPIDTNDTDAGRQRNRRVEFVIVEVE